MKKEAYARRLKLQNRWLIAAFLFTLAFMVVVGETALLDSRTKDDTMKGMQALFFLWQGAIIWRYVRNRRLLADPGMLLWQQMQDGDERRELILGKAGGRFAVALCIVLSVAAIAASFYNAVVFYTLYAVLLFSLALFGALLLVYRRKFG